jgi:hypothetical protein
VRPFSLVVLLAALAGGCGSGLYPVEGQVVWEDGSPAAELAGSYVLFDLPEKQTSAQGMIQPDGRFHLTTNEPNDGAPTGTYTVMIIEVGRKSLAGGESGAIAPGAMDARFSDPSTSGLTATIEPRDNQVTLKVARAPR